MADKGENMEEARVTAKRFYRGINGNQSKYMQLSN